MSEEENIDKILEGLADETEKEKQELQENTEETNVEKKKTGEIDASEDDDLMQEVVKMTVDDRRKADDLYNVFLPEVSQGKDRSQASKEAMSKAVELKIASAKNIIELLKVKKSSDSKTNVGVFMGDTMSHKKAGIDVNNISNEINE